MYRPVYLLLQKRCICTEERGKRGQGGRWQGPPVTNLVSQRVLNKGLKFLMSQSFAEGPTEKFNTLGTHVVSEGVP